MVRTAENDDLLDDLFRHPAWKVLEERLKARKTTDTQSLALALLHVDKPLDQRSVDATRGFWRGADWFLKETKRGVRAFAKTDEDGEGA